VAAKEPPPPEIAGLAHVTVLDHFLKLEHSHDLVAGVVHLEFLRRGEDNASHWVSLRAGGGSERRRRGILLAWGVSPRIENEERRKAPEGGDR
jgi:hypothetical protein